MANVLITGGAGYIGSILVRLLLFNGYKVRVLDNLRWGGESLLGVYHHPDFEFIKGDIRNEKDLSTALHGVNDIIHLAAIVGDPACKREPILATETNLEASKNLFEKAKDRGVERFVFASTCSNYGKMVDPDAYVTEESSLKPVSLYAELKVSFEKYILESERKQGFVPVSLRFPTAYGISPRLRFDLTVNEFVREIYMGKELIVFGEKFWRPYCHVWDLARACLAILEAPAEVIDHEVFNVGDTEENYQKKMLVEEIRRFLPEAQIRYVHKDEDPRDYKVDFSKIKGALGFSVTKKIPDGIREVIDVLSMNILRNSYDASYKNT